MDKKSDNNEPESEDAKIKESAILIKAQYENINLYNNSVQSSRVLINGDITAYGHKWQAEKMLISLASLNRDTFWGLGNHDIENNQNDCINDSCFTLMMNIMTAHIKMLSKKPDIQVSSDMFDNGIKIRGSLAYSINFGKIFSLQLQNYPTMTYYNKIHGEVYDLIENLDWIENQLQNATNKGRFIIVNVHKPDHWKNGPNERFKKMLEHYKVKVIFSGHYHKHIGRYDTNYFGNIPVFLSGSASQETYLIAELVDNEFNIYSVRNNDYKNKKLEQTINVI